MPNTARRMSIYYNQPEKYFLGWLVRVRGEDQAGPLRCRGLFRGIASPAVLCHKEPDRASKAPSLLLAGSLWHKDIYRL